MIGGWVLLNGLGHEAVESYSKNFNVAFVNCFNDTIAVEDARSGAALSYMPQNVSAIIVPDEEGLRALEAWRGAVHVSVPALIHTPATPQLLITLAQHQSAAAKATTNLMLQLAELRAVHEELHNSYNAIRNYLHEGGFLPPRLGFVNLPDVDGTLVEESVTEITQPIPVELRAVCAVSLHVNTPSPLFSEGKLLVELGVVEEDGALFSWVVPYGSLSEGWITFAFEQNSGFWRQTPLLRLRFETFAGTPPRISLGREQLRSDKAAVIDGGTGFRSLAFKTWQSIPGAPLTLSKQMLPVIRLDRRPITQIELVFDETIAFAHLYRPDLADDFERVTLFASDRRIQVHPVENQITFCCLYGVCPIGTSTVIAEVETASPEASHIEYAIAALPPEAARSVSLHGVLPETAEVSDWLLLPPQTAGVLQLALPKPLTGVADLYLMTRLPPGQGARYGWSQFRRVAFKGNYN